MKKFFLKGLSILMIGVSSLTLTSCDPSNLNLGDIVTGLLGMLMGGQKGETYNFEAQSGIAQLWILNAEKENYYYDEAQDLSMVNCHVAVTDRSKSADLSFPAMEIAGAEMSAVTVSGIGMEQAEDGQYINLYIPESGNSGEGTLTVEGKSYSLTGVVLEDVYVSSVDALLTKVQLFFGENDEYVVNITDVSATIIKTQE